MKPIHLLAGLLAALLALLSTITVTGFQSSYETPLMFYTGLVFGQLALLVFWCVMSRGYRVARVLATLAITACLSQPLGRVTGCSWSQWFTLLSLFAAITSGALLLARLPGIVPGRGNRVTSPAPSQRRRPRTQFTLGGLLSLTTAVAVSLGLRGHIEFPHEERLAVASYGLWLIVIAIASFWSSASSLRPGVRVLVLAVVCLAAGSLMAHTEHYQSTWFFTNIAVIEATIICVGVSITTCRSADESRVTCPVADDG